MLQQTRVETVVPYYHRFLERFPSLEALAAAPPDAVLAAWSGLGYYRRARHLHAAAVRLVEDLGGCWPRTAVELVKLPGFGPYTASAVASIAFGEAVPVLDGNVIRVLSRLEAYTGMATSSTGRRHLNERAASLLDPLRPGDSNQAAMELGATVCRPRRPDCGTCPLSGFCATGPRGAAEGFPLARRRRATERQVRVAVVVERHGRVLLFRRPDGEAVLPGTWELPWVDGAGDRIEHRLRQRYGGEWRIGDAAGRVRHAITFRALEVEVRRATVRGRSDDGKRRSGWFDSAEMRRLPLSSLVTKALAEACPRADRRRSS